LHIIFIFVFVLFSRLLIKYRVFGFFPVLSRGRPKETLQSGGGGTKVVDQKKDYTKKGLKTGGKTGGHSRNATATAGNVPDTRTV